MCNTKLFNTSLEHKKCKKNYKTLCWFRENASFCQKEYYLNELIYLINSFNENTSICLEDVSFS